MADEGAVSFKNTQEQQQQQQQQENKNIQADGQISSQIRMIHKAGWPVY